MPVRLELHGATFRHMATAPWVFKDVELSFSPGIYGIFGPNGSGKTTMLHCIAGLHTLLKGTVQFEMNQKVLRGKRMLERLGYVSQEPAFYEDMKVRDFLIYVARLKLISTKLITSRVDQMLEQFALVPYADLPIEVLSIGQRKKLSIAQALLNEPHLLLLDEALEGLDLEERSLVLELLQETAKDSIVLMASHIITEIEQWIEHAVFLVHGKVYGPKTPQQWKWLMMNETGGSEGHVSVPSATSKPNLEQLPTPKLEEVYLDLMRTAKANSAC